MAIFFLCAVFLLSANLMTRRSHLLPLYSKPDLGYFFETRSSIVLQKLQIHICLAFLCSRQLFKEITESALKVDWRLFCFFCFFTYVSIE